MNKEILFHGKRLDNGEWVEGFYFFSKWYLNREFTGEITHYIRPVGAQDAFQVDPATVGRCAPIPDNIGKAMFEGDIIRMHGNPKDLAVVEFGEFSCVSIDPEELVDKVFGWHYRPLPTDELSQLEPFCWEFQINEMWVKENDIRVIGNIHDNPELTKNTTP